MFSKVKKEVLFVRIILKDFSRSAVSFEGSGATDWRAGGASVGPLCDRPVASRATWCEAEGVKGYIDCHTAFDCDILMGFMFALSKFCSQNSTQKIP